MGKRGKEGERRKREMKSTLPRLTAGLGIVRLKNFLKHFVDFELEGRGEGMGVREGIVRAHKSRLQGRNTPFL